MHRAPVTDLPLTSVLCACPRVTVSPAEWLTLVLVSVVDSAAASAADVATVVTAVDAETAATAAAAAPASRLGSPAMARITRTPAVAAAARLFHHRHPVTEDHVVRSPHEDIVLPETTLPELLLSRMEVRRWRVESLALGGH